MNLRKPSIHPTRGWWLCLLPLLAACGPEKEKTETLVVATAANVQYAMQEIKDSFEAKHPVSVDLIVSSSGKLTAQIQQGAPYDLLVSADMKYPADLFAKGYALGPPKVYAHGALVVWTKQHISLDSLPSLLRNPNIKKIALANPKVAPYGQLAFDWLQQQQLLSEVQKNLVYGESIAQTSQYILSGACDLGFTARSIVLSPHAKDQGFWADLEPPMLLEQGAVITLRGQREHPRSAQLFFDFLFSEQAQAILQSYGYETKNGSAWQKSG